LRVDSDARRSSDMLRHDYTGYTDEDGIAGCRGMRMTMLPRDHDSALRASGPIGLLRSSTRCVIQDVYTSWMILRGINGPALECCFQTAHGEQTRHPECATIFRKCGRGRSAVVGFIGFSVIEHLALWFLRVSFILSIIIDIFRIRFGLLFHFVNFVTLTLDVIRVSLHVLKYLISQSEKFYELINQSMCSITLIFIMIFILLIFYII